MPLIMDNEMDVDIDDLFGDGGLALPASTAPTKELVARIDELRETGACQGIAWSRNGSIVSIAPDGCRLEIRTLQCRPNHGNWELSPPTVFQPFPPATDGSRLQHLSWSPNGVDLAVVDSAGRISILSSPLLLNKMDVRRDCRTDTVDDLHAVVGVYWMNLVQHPAERMLVCHGPAIKTSSKSYQYHVSHIPSFGPTFPNPSKSALLCVTANGTLRLFWTSTNGTTWQDQTTELESIISSDDFVTHAAICADKTIAVRANPKNVNDKQEIKTLLVAFATASKQIRIIRVWIKWNNPTDKTMTWSVNVTPKHLVSTSWAADSDSSDDLQNESGLDRCAHLEFLPPSPEGQTPGHYTMPTVVMARVSMPSSNSQFGQETRTRTIIDRWELQDSSQTVHTAFEQLNSKRNSGTPRPNSFSILKKQEQLTSNKILVSIQPIKLSKVVVFAYSDGSIEYRDRKTFSETYNEINLEKFNHLTEIGFSFVEEEPRVQFAFSPTCCSAVQSNNDGQVKWMRMEFMGQMGSSSADANYAAVIAGINMAWSTAVTMNVGYEDVLAVAPRNAPPNFAHDLQLDLSRVVKFNADYSEETHHDNLVRNQGIHIYLGFQNSLGFNGEFSRRSFSGKFAWLTLQLRHVVVLVTMASNFKSSDGHKSPLEDPAVVKYLSGPVKWGLDLMVWITDELLFLWKDKSQFDITGLLSGNSSTALRPLNARLKSENNAAVHLVLSSVTRGFLTAICRRILHLQNISHRTIAQYQEHARGGPAMAAINPVSLEVFQAYTAIATICGTCPLPVRLFEVLLNNISTSVKAAYAANPKTHVAKEGNGQAQQQARNVVELIMLSGGMIPDVLAQVVGQLLGGFIQGVRNEIAPDRLFFYDFGALGVRDSEEDLSDRRVGKGKARVVTDAFRKVEVVMDLGKDGGQAGQAGQREEKWRRCVRCAAVMDDVFAGNTTLLVFWIVQQQRKCYCSGHWVGL